MNIAECIGTKRAQRAVQARGVSVKEKEREIPN